MAYKIIFISKFRYNLFNCLCSEFNQLVSLSCHFYRDGQQAALRAIEIDPDHGFAHGVLGLIHMGAHSWDEAMREYELAIRLNPNETNTLLWKGIAFTSLGYVDQAIAMFQQAERLDPVFTNVHNWLAIGYGTKGDIENLRRHTQKLQSLDPGFPGNTLTILWLNSANLDIAEDLMRAQELKYLGTDSLVAAMFSALRDAGRKEQAVNTLLANKALAKGGDLTPYLWTIGAVDETLANFHEQRGRGLRIANSLPTLWAAYNRAQLSNPAMPAFFETNGLVDYWRKHGDPDYCRVDGAAVKCGDL